MAGFLPMWSPIGTNIGDGSNLWSTALDNKAKAAGMLNDAINTIRTNQQNEANTALLQAYQKAIANGATPDEARANAAANANAFTTAAALNDMFQTSRNDIYSNIQQAQEDRTAKDWQGQNEAASINALAAQAFRLRNTQAFNDAMAQGNDLDPVAKKYLKYEDLVQQDLLDDNKRLDLEKGKLDMANTRQAMAERARRAKLEEQQLAGLDLIAKTNAVMAGKGYDPKSSTYGSIYRDTLHQIAKDKGIGDPDYFVARFAPDYLPYIKEGSIYDKGINLAPAAQASTDAEVQSLENATNYTDDGVEDTSMARGMEKKGVILNASRAQAFKQAVDASDMTLTAEQKTKLAELAKNPKATAKDFNDFADEVIKTNDRILPEWSDLLKTIPLGGPAFASGLASYTPFAQTMNETFNLKLPYIHIPADVSALKNIRFTDTGSGIESVAKTQDAQNHVTDFMTRINAANDAYAQRVNDSRFLQNSTKRAKQVAFDINPANISQYDAMSLYAQANEDDIVYDNQLKDIKNRYSSVFAKLGKANADFNPLDSVIKASTKDYEKTEEQLAKQLGYGDDIPKFRKKYSKAFNYAKELGASDAGARIAIQMVIDEGKWESSTFTPDWRDNNLAGAVKTVNDIEAKSPGILTRISTLTLAQTRNSLIKEISNAQLRGDTEMANKLQQQLRMTYSKGYVPTATSAPTSN